MVLEGRIGGDPEFSGSRVQFTLGISAVDLGFGLVPSENRVLVYAYPPDDLVVRRSPPFFDYGDLVSITGTLRQPEPFGGFDYPAYLASQGITGIVLADSAIVTKEGGGWRDRPYSLRGRLSESIEDTIPYPQSVLGRALLLGLRADLSPEVVQDFRSTGPSHLLAISGLHVGVLVVMCLGGAGLVIRSEGPLFSDCAISHSLGLRLGFGTAAVGGAGRRSWAASIWRWWGLGGRAASSRRWP